MSQYKKLFDKSEIEYITPFLKLWMSFNNWYKKDLSNTSIKTDRDAINNYKTQGEIKTNFLRLFEDSSELGIEFNIAIYELVLNIKNYKLLDRNDNPVDYERGLILENMDERSRLNPIYISETKLRFQISSDKKEILFSNSLEIIYQIRSSLVHGDFDIENLYFSRLVKASYNILYPIMDRILMNEENE